VNKERRRKYNNPRDLEELCQSFLKCSETDRGAAIQYCKDFLMMLTEKPPVTGAVVSVRAKSR
jgi:hypothetical protein